jgi:hypothetical protein
VPTLHAYFTVSGEPGLREHGIALHVQQRVEGVLLQTNMNRYLNEFEAEYRLDATLPYQVYDDLANSLRHYVEVYLADLLGLAEMTVLPKWRIS